MTDKKENSCLVKSKPLTEQVTRNNEKKHNSNDIQNGTLILPTVMTPSIKKPSIVTMDSGTRILSKKGEREKTENK